MLEERYNGDNSHEFWGIINLIDDEDLTLYKFGCDLQNLESKVLKKINERIRVIEELKRSHDKRMKGKHAKKN